MKAAQQPPVKKPRSAAQQLAFEKCRLARQEATKRKLIESGQLVEPQAVVEQEGAVMEDEDNEELPAVQVTQVKKKQQPVVQQQIVEEEYETVDFDPNEVYQRTEAYQAELAQLKEHVHGLHGKHETLECDFKQYGVKQAMPPILYE
jgi:hypothetical protein